MDITKSIHLTQKSWPESLKTFISKSHALGLERIPIVNPLQSELDKEVVIGMKQKKVSETKSTAFEIDLIAKSQNATHILDLGAGQGYLSSVLAYQYGYHVIAIDRDINKTSGGEQRASRIHNLYKHHQVKVSGTLRFMTGYISTLDTMDGKYGNW